jgi:hypothetical protein
MLVKIMLFAKSYGWIHDPPEKTEIEMMSPSSPMDIKLEQFLQKSGFTNTHISEKVHLGFSSNFQKITSIYGL